MDSILLQGLLWMDLALVGGILAILVRHRKSSAVRYGALYLGLIECYLALWLAHASLSGGLPSLWRIALAVVILILPWSFWIFAYAVFEDGFRIGRLHAGILAAKVALAVVSHAGRPGYDLFSLSTEGQDLLRLFPNVIFSFALIFHSLIIAHRGRETDLVEARLDLRKTFAYLLGGIIGWFMLSFLVLRPLGFNRPVDLINASLIGGIALAFLSLAMNIRPGLLPDTDPLTQNEGGEIPVDPELQQRIIQSFEEKHIYRVEGLTIGQLARTLNIQEYRLRRVINRQMGFRNFNDLLNRYRIQEACDLLATGDLPVIRIATEIGYPSPAPFNRAFRQITGLTPTEYRRRSKAEKSGPPRI